MKQFRILIPAVLVGLNCITSVVYADSERSEINIDGICYTYTETDNGITINSIETNNKNLIIPSVINNKTVTKLADKVCAYNESLKTVELPETISEIGMEAFVECTNLETINIPDNVTLIDALCFSQCSSLTEISLPDKTETIGHYAFSYCTSLKTANIPANLTEIPDGMYADCSALTSITIPDSVNKIGVSAFGSCGSLSDIQWDLTADSISPNAFDGTPWLEDNPDEFLILNNGTLLFAYNGTEKNVVIPSTVTEISDGIFSNHTEIESVKIPAGITGISSLMFSGCSALKSVDLPDSLEYIGMGGFGECSSLTEIVIPENVRTIKEKAFVKCTSLQKVQLPSGLETLGRQAFLQCTALKTINIPSMICSNIDRNTFGAEVMLENVTLEGKMTDQLAEALHVANWNGGDTEFVIYDDILTSYNGSGGNVIIPDGVTEIGAYVFQSKAITSIILPHSLTKIGQAAFYGVTGITDLLVPGSVTEIGQMAFAECTNLKNISFEPGDSSVSLGNSSFQSTAVTEDSFITNGRVILNSDAAFTNTALEIENTVTATEASAAIETESTQDVLNVLSNENRISVNINGKDIDFGEDKPLIDDAGRTQVPIRYIAEALHCRVDWKDAEQTAVIITEDGMQINITIGNNLLISDGNTIEMDTEAMIVNGRTYIPVRFLGDAMGISVCWIQNQDTP